MLNTLVGPVSNILDKFVPDAGEKARLAHEIATLADRQAHEIAIAQIEVNKAEAASSSLFKGGWRPFIGWTCGAAFAYHFLVQPLLIFVFVVLGNDPPPLPEFNISALLPVLGGMLGLGGFRTFERINGVIPAGK